MRRHQGRYEAFVRGAATRRYDAPDAGGLLGLAVALVVVGSVAALVGLLGDGPVRWQALVVGLGVLAVLEAVGIFRRRRRRRAG